MDLTELKRLHDKAYTAGQVTRERAADDLVFYWVTQWDDNILADSQLAYRGEFNILRKAGRQILSDLAMNQVQVDFEQGLALNMGQWLSIPFILFGFFLLYRSLKQKPEIK